MRKKKNEKEFNVVRLSPDELIHADEYETKPDENYDAEDDPVTEMELLQYRMDVMDAINSAWDKLQGMDENGYVSVEMPMSPYEKRERGIKRLKPEDIDWSDTEFCENHEFTLEELMNAPEPTDTKAMINRIRASARCLKKSSDRTMREINDFQEALDKNGGKIVNINEIAMKVLKEQDEKNAKKGRTFVMSDINGDYEKYTELLKKINFGPDDTLYVLGDAIGPDASEHNPRGEYEAELLNEKLKRLISEPRQKIKVTYFVPDDKKQGGEYITQIKTVRRVDETLRRIIFEDKSETGFEDLVDIDV